MVWDASAYLVTIKAIGMVESNFYYGAVNPSDSITIGVAQWYGTRAANILFRAKAEATTAFDTYCPATIANDMLTHPANDTWWNSRHVTQEEIKAFRNFLTRLPVKIIQEDQLINDIEEYLQVAAAWGLNKDTETAATAFFCTVYHQSPRAAGQICAVLPSPTNLDNIYQATLNNDIVGDYVTRQTEAYNIILNGDTGGVNNPNEEPLDTEPPLPTDGEGGTNGGNRRKTKDHYLVDRGNVRILYHKDGSTTTFYKSGGVYLAADGSKGTKYTGGTEENGEVDGETPPVPTNPTAPKGTAADIIAFARSKLGAFSYSQGPGRLTPEISGYTDCSAFLVYAFQKGGNISLGGTYTGNLCTRGTFVGEGAVPQSQMNPGDLIFIRWGSAVRGNSPFDHVVLYCGATRISMGYTPGPNEGPWNVDYSALSNGGRIQVRRYL